MTTVSIIDIDNQHVSSKGFETFWSARLWAEEEVKNPNVLSAVISSPDGLLEIGCNHCGQ